MNALYLANVLVVLIAAWAVWERRLTFGSPWDAPITYGILLFGLGAALDSPWPGMAVVSYPFTGKYYLAMVAGHICYLVGASMGIRSIYARLLSDEESSSFARRRITPVIAAGSAVMVTCAIASPLTSTLSVDHLYLIAPDRWLTVYWLAFLGTMALLAIISVYGLFRLRADSRSVMIDLQIASQVVGMQAAAAIAFGVVTHRIETAGHLVWPAAYAGIVGGAVAMVIAWRHRVRGLTAPE